MALEQAFAALEPETLPSRLGTLEILTEKLGPPSGWQVREVGDGNLNLVFIVEGGGRSMIVKQALPYVRLVGEGWPLPLTRSFFEYSALVRQAERAPESVPEVYYFDERQAIIVQEFLSPHIILRKALIDGQMLPRLAQDIGLFMARTLFRGSDLSMEAAARKKDMALFAGNDALCDITEALVFTDPYYDAEMNSHTSPELDGIVAKLRADRDLKVTAQEMKQAFVTRAETMLHGDLHTGSIMVTEDETRVIDPEFAYYGPMAFDVGMLLANYWMSYFSQRGHEQNGPRDDQRRYLLDTITATWSVFRDEFSRLWRDERTGILFQRSLYEDQGDALGAEQALERFLHGLFEDMLGFAGLEIHRRILGLAHNADFETIADRPQKARSETAALEFGRHIAVNRRHISSLDALERLASRLEEESAP
ncbi:S-methyl-5-thioribose kinase [Martelella soudanensis]|uniref:S-methyl-5-thioribose kinase n=1 Tax=unclassified Martelella TaxID=2629616 RepID=UPI0015DFE66C|nr:MULTISPECIES: S-methyl-5-thioribose kinase [unclassified Martelella]